LSKKDLKNGFSHKDKYGHIHFHLFHHSFCSDITKLFSWEKITHNLLKSLFSNRTTPLNSFIEKKNCNILENSYRIKTNLKSSFRDK